MRDLISNEDIHVDAKTLEPIESKLAFLERANIELSDVVARQQREIAILQAQMKGLREELKTRPLTEQPLTLEEERPPHY